MFHSFFEWLMDDCYGGLIRSWLSSSSSWFSAFLGRFVRPMAPFTTMSRSLNHLIFVVRFIILNLLIWIGRLCRCFFGTRCKSGWGGRRVLDNTWCEVLAI